MNDVQKIISSLIDSKLQFESDAKRYKTVSEGMSKLCEGSANGLDLAIQLVKIHSGISLTEQYMEEDIYHDESKLT